jgi:hypothetical protein
VQSGAIPVPFTGIFMKYEREKGPGLKPKRQYGLTDNIHIEHMSVK